MLEEITVYTLDEPLGEATNNTVKAIKIEFEYGPKYVVYDLQKEKFQIFHSVDALSVLYSLDAPKDSFVEQAVKTYYDK